MRFGRIQRRKTGVAVTRAVSLVLFMAVLFRHALLRHAQFLLSPVLARLMSWVTDDPCARLYGASPL